MIIMHHRKKIVENSYVYIGFSIVEIIASVTVCIVGTTSITCNAFFTYVGTNI